MIGYKYELNTSTNTFEVTGFEIIQGVIELVRIRREAAEEIERLRKEGHDNRVIIENALNSDVEELSYLANNEFDDLLRALMDGYSVKGTAKEEIKSYYDQAKHAAWEAEDSDDETEFEVNSAKKEAVEFVLDELGVRIEGINDK